MTLPQAIETIEKHQESINDQVVRMDDVFAPDEYYLAVASVLPMLKCLNCLSSWASKNTDGFIARCEDEINFCPIPHQDAKTELDKTNVPCCARGGDYIPSCEKSTLSDADKLSFGWHDTDKFAPPELNADELPFG